MLSAEKQTKESIVYRFTDVWTGSETPQIPI